MTPRPVVPCKAGSCSSVDVTLRHPGIIVGLLVASALLLLVAYVAYRRHERKRRGRRYDFDDRGRIK